MSSGAPNQANTFNNLNTEIGNDKLLQSKFE